ncbi:pirin family protein [Chitinophaga polysaccharea]|uniref:pirin family protein n=1 Tax=Chitinophaga TaxID=79328 RepID=UPI00145552F6|nr:MULTISPECIES: pirin family protein [Chitinophaga]NLR61577.1 pirin family protein [Chitinophaga polysaccharea]NLU93828.1 pirin family protein [Chitinophaga sp. Ak27]
MKKVIHRADTRGYANHGWLKSHHTFSFANYYDPSRIHFGALRVLNDDAVKGGMGFGAHPHDNMEIVSIVLDGALEHRDNTGKQEIIRKNDIQIMSAGTGVVHSEFNASKTEDVNFLQIWVIPAERNVAPRYDQRTFNPASRENKLQVVIAPDRTADTLWLHQDAWFSLGKFDAGKTVAITAKKAGTGSYLFLLSGEIKVDGEILQTRDAIGLSEYNKTTVEIIKPAEFLLIDVPMLS